MKELKWLVLLAVSVTLTACGNEHAQNDHGHDHGEDTHAHGESAETESWAVTSWGNLYEIFAEADPLAVGVTSKSHTHVTILEGFLPLAEGEVSAVLRADDGAESVFRRDEALRPGIFSIEITPTQKGVFDLYFRVVSASGTEDIPSGYVRVGDPSNPGGLIDVPSNPISGAGGVRTGSAPVGFLKEQQWKTEFATDWSVRGAIQRTVRGTARVRPAANGEAVVAAPVGGTVASRLNLHTGMAVNAGEDLLALLPRASSDQSMSEIRSELSLARSRLERLEGLHAIGAVSLAEVEGVRARITALAPLVESTTTEGQFAMRSPLKGQVAEVWVRPGQAVHAGDPLVRVVRTSPIWLDIALDPASAGAVEAGIAGLSVRPPGASQPIVFEQEQLRLVAVSPALDATTGNVAAIVEVTHPSPGLLLGLSTEAEIATTSQDSGVVVPRAAILDDGGNSIVYVQTEGESFERVEVHLVAVEGHRAVVSGLNPGERVVTRGGAMIRRASLLSSGGIEGHVH